MCGHGNLESANGTTTVGGGEVSASAAAEAAGLICLAFMARLEVAPFQGDGKLTPTKWRKERTGIGIE